MSLAVEPSSDLERTLRERFGLERFRPGQREVIENVLERRDVLCVMPTGGGKSLCYQLPAVLLPGLTLVVSPLIALMKDQVDVLVQKGFRATLLNSTLDLEEQRVRLQEIEAGRYDLVYVAPERFRSPRFVESMRRIKPALLAIDEAHCISEWGHDFRPDYAKIGQARKALGFPPCIALTATATDIVRRDIADQLDLQDPAEHLTGFDRPNLKYASIEARRDEEKLAALARILDGTPGSAIVYASSRARCEMIGVFLEKELRRPTVIYHAGLHRDDRTSAQDRFMGGQAEVVVATNAFGMGVDKADIRSVVHFNMPGTLEAYYQEAGRAGRDGKEAQCVLLYAPGDRKLQELFIENEYPARDVIYRIYDFLRSLDTDPIELTHTEVREQSGIDVNESAIGTALKLLESAGGVERFLPRENQAIVRINGEGDQGSFADRLGSQAHVQRVVLLGIEGLVNRRYGEPIYFHPDTLAKSLGLDRPALNRALKHLSSDLPIDYVPPFRGNAVKVHDRGRRARDIDIDFAALEERKRRGYDKLELMVRYATSNECRRKVILGYFGDTSTIHCGHCDNCEGKGGGSATTRAAIDTPEGRDVLLKALSGVARAKGRFGKTMVAQMLIGSKAEKVLRARLDELTTFGLLNAFRQPEVVQLLDALTRSGLIETQEVESFRPVISVSDYGRSFLKDPSAMRISLELPTDLSAKINLGGLSRDTPRPAIATTTAAPAEPDEYAELKADPLWDRLKALRQRLSKEEDRPAYSIFPDTALASLVRERPRVPNDLLTIKNFGPARVERYGRAILGVIAGDVPPPAVPKRSEPKPIPPPIPSPPRTEAKPPPPASAPPSTVSPTVTRPATSSTSGYVPTEEWTRRLLEKGFAPHEVAAIRGLELSAIVRHATLLARAGKSIAIEAFISVETLARWRAFRAEQPGASPPDAETMADAWALFIASHK